MMQSEVCKYDMDTYSSHVPIQILTEIDMGNAGYNIHIYSKTLW